MEFQDIFNQMLTDKVTIVSNGWPYCEDETTLPTWKALIRCPERGRRRITVLNGSGDSGSTCLDGSANTIVVPADSPNAIAVRRRIGESRPLIYLWLRKLVE